MANMFNGTKNLSKLFLNKMNFDKVTSSSEMFVGSNPEITITVKDENAKQFIKNNTTPLNIPDEKIILFNTSTDNTSSSSSSSDRPSSSSDQPSSSSSSSSTQDNTSSSSSSSSSSTKKTGPVDNPKTGILSMSIIFGLFIIISTAYMSFKKNKMFQQV